MNDPGFSSCHKCLGMGLYIDEYDGLAKACSCPTGRERRETIAAWDDKYKYYKAPSRFARKEVEDGEPY